MKYQLFFMTVGKLTYKARPCKKDEFACSNKKCIPTDLQCDRLDDCGDGSDEEGCRMCEFPFCSSAVTHKFNFCFIMSKFILLF